MQKILLPWVICVSLITSGCFGSGGSNNQENSGSGRPGGNQAPTISGAPPIEVLQDETYLFQPAAVDPDGDTLSFVITGKPVWAEFDSTTGRLSGSPLAGDVGYYSNITISVSDGRASASLPAFDVSVTQTGSDSVTLSWLPPTENVDGSTLTNLTGYRIYVGKAADALTRVIVLHNPGLTRYVVEHLSAATWYFAMSSVNSRGKESTRSATISETIY